MMRRRLLILAIPREITHFSVVHAYHAISAAGGHGSRVCFSGHICGSVDLVIVDKTEGRRGRGTVREECARGKIGKAEERKKKKNAIQLCYGEKDMGASKIPSSAALFFFKFCLVRNFSSRWQLPLNPIRLAHFIER